MFKNPLVVAGIAWVYVILIFLFGFLFGFYAGAALFFAGIAALLAFIVMSLPGFDLEKKEETL